MANEIKRCLRCGSELTEKGCPDINCWLDAWESEYADGRTRISRAEAIRRYSQEFGDEAWQL